MGGGVAVLDCDEDGRPRPLLRGRLGASGAVREPQRRGWSAPVRALSRRGHGPDRVTGAYPLDIDSDGILDLAVLRHGEDVLLRGLGDCAFERANEAWRFDGGDDWTTAFSATWEAGQTWPTLAFGTYIDHVDDQGVTWCGLGSLVRPRTGGRRLRATRAAGPGHCALSMLFSDWNRTGRRDLRVSNDRHYYREDGEEQLWRLRARCSRRASTAATRAGESVSIWGMGIASQDLTGDGLPEVYLTSIGSNRAGDPRRRRRRADLRGRRPRPRRDRHHAGRREAHQPVDVMASRVRRRQQRRPHGPLHLEGQRRCHPGQRQRSIPASCSWADRMARFLRAAKRADIIDPARTRGAALVDLNADGLLDIVRGHACRERHAAAQPRSRRRRGAPRRWATGWPSSSTRRAPTRTRVGAWIEVEAGKAALVP